MAARNTNLSLISFFKIMWGDFSTKLRVPPEFVKNFKHTTASRNFTVTLRPELKLSWKVKVERSSNGSASWDYYFTKGWNKMVKDLELACGDFLVFYLVAEDSFQLAVYDRTCCEKNITPPPPTTTSNKKKPVDYNAGTSRPNPEHVLERTISKGYLSHGSMPIPWSFVQRNFNSECTKRKITLRTEDGQWQVDLHSYPENSQARIVGGFAAFLKENILEVGDKCKFELINREQNVFMVSIHRVGQKKNKKKQTAA